MRLKHPILLPLFAFALICATSHVSHADPFVKGSLNFVVNNDLIVQSLSAEDMELGAQKEAIFGAHIVKQLPLSEHDSAKIQNALAKARNTQKHEVVHYRLGAHPICPNTKRYFHAVITPLVNAGGPAGFFINVREVNLQCEE